jgi:ABC-2 type transport system ATP-binding protein
MDNIIEIDKLRKKYKGFLLDEISLNVPKGSILGFLGPNGAGKTTIIKILMNMVRADGGSARIFGMDHIQSEKAVKNRIGYVGEDQYYYGDKTVGWTGKFVSKFYDDWDTNRFQSYLTDFDISRTKRIRELSKGMKTKFALALALSHHPDLILLDEPTAGLDPIIRREVLEILRVVTIDENKSVIISSHITDDIMRIADYVTFLIDGKIRLFEAKDELLANWKRIHYRDGTLEQSLVDSLKNRQVLTFGRSGVTDRYPDIKESLAQGLAEETVKVENIRLDDILVTFVKGE